MYSEELNKYLAEIGKYPLLSLEKEKELAIIIQSSEIEADRIKAENDLIMGNLRLVVDCALKTFKSTSEQAISGLTVMDLIQAGNIGLMKSAKGFKVENEVKFCSYAYIAIAREIGNTIKENRFVHVPDDHPQIFARISELAITYGRELTDEEITKELGVSPRMIKRLKANQDSQPVDIEDWGSLNDSIGDPNIADIDASIEKQELKEYLLDKIDELTPLEKQAVYLAFFNSNEKNYAEVARKMNISRQRADIIIKKALKKLKNKMDQEKAMKSVGIDSIKIKKESRKVRESKKKVINNGDNKSPVLDILEKTA